MSERCFLAIDLGAESGRVIAGLFDGQRVRLDELHRFRNGPVDVAGTRRWDVLRLWTDIQDGLAKAAEKYGDSIVSVGVDTWGVDYVLLSKHEELLGQPYNYRDPRTTGMIEYATSKVPRSEIFAATGLQFIPINSLYQLLGMQQKDPELLASADRLLMMPDFFHWLLCGSRVIEFTNATTSQCLNPVTRDWAVDMLRKLEIPTHIFPEVVSPGTKLGPLREEVARATGLPRLDVVTPATHDTACAVAAVPTSHTGRANWAYISSGTWSLIGVEVQEAILGEEALAQNVTNEGGIDGTYRLLKNVMGLWLVQECRRSFERAGRSYDYEELTRIASEAEPFKALIDPNDESFLSPADMVEAIQNWCRSHGEPVPESDGALVRCALESLALKYRQVLEGIERLTGEKVEVIHVVGGGSKNALLNQLTADACGVPVIAGPTEATALGNVLVQARAAGEIGTLADIRSVVQKSSELETFEPAEKAAWNDAWERFTALTR
ncbi:Rhamnulokinase [Maioricimonas rarisocia]|uniref:Rhamnulokinase n=1 Tax=Maioricimonas rarisocia TaxID=2528026 RepID=A0A517ZGA6_9PLAN|nr:rhamnulokinase [Maioricimonas rarisocia]QDU41518.1 Rhamnulokinase [Maioricimonas rarisocia]